MERYIARIAQISRSAFGWSFLNNLVFVFVIFGWIGQLIFPHFSNQISLAISKHLKGSGSVRSFVIVLTLFTLTLFGPDMHLGGRSQRLGILKCNEMKDDIFAPMQ